MPNDTKTLVIWWAGHPQIHTSISLDTLTIGRNTISKKNHRSRRLTQELKQVSRCISYQFNSCLFISYVCTTATWRVKLHVLSFFHHFSTFKVAQLHVLFKSLQLLFWCCSSQFYSCCMGFELLLSRSCNNFEDCAHVSPSSQTEPWIMCCTLQTDISSLHTFTQPRGLNMRPRVRFSACGWWRPWERSWYTWALGPSVSIVSLITNLWNILTSLMYVEGKLQGYVCNSMKCTINDLPITIFLLFFSSWR